MQTTRTVEEGQVAAGPLRRSFGENPSGSIPGRNEPSPILGASLLPFLGGTNDDEGDTTGSVDNAAMNNSSTISLGAGSPKTNTEKGPERFSPEIGVANSGDAITGYYGNIDGICSEKIHHLSLLLDGGRIPSDAATVSAAANDTPNIDGNREAKKQKHGTRRGRSRSKRRKRILLRGPPRSGKSSLAMDLAYSEAAANYDCCDGLPCDCIAAIVYRTHSDQQIHEGTEGHYNDDRFPLFCHPLSQGLNSDCCPSKNPEGIRGFEETGAGNSHRRTTGSHGDNGSSSWHPKLLRKIRVCRVSSVRDLWWDLLVLAGRPVNEQPTRAIIIEDLDKLMGPVGDYVFGGVGGSEINKNKSNIVVSSMLKTLGIAADTALAIENRKRRNSTALSPPNCLTLLLTFSIEDQQQHRRLGMTGANNPDMGLISPITKATSDALVVASCIDTVVTLQPKQREASGVSFETRSIDVNDDFEEWKKSTTAIGTALNAHTGGSGKRKSNSGIDNSSTSMHENIFVHGVYEAEIQEPSVEQVHERDTCKSGATSGIFHVDYAFVESLPIDSDAMEEFDNPMELRWKYSENA